VIKISTITAPSLPSYPFYIGKGVTGSNGTLTLFGYPLPNYLSSDFNSIVGNTPYTIQNPTTNFDVSSLTEDHEVVLVMYYNTSTHITSQVNFAFNWYREHDNKCVFSYSSYISAPPIGSYYPGIAMTAWIGWLSENSFEYLGGYYEEIMENGYYRCEINITGGLTDSGTIPFVVTSMPAFTRLSNITDTTADWKVGFSNTFDTNSYISAGVCTQSFVNGQSTRPDGVVSYVIAGSSSTACVATGTLYGLTPGTTYTLYGFVCAANGLYYTCGSDSITTTGSARPDYFYWDNIKTSGNTFDIKASEWTRLIQDIKDMHVYKLGSYNPSSYPLTNPYQGETFWASYFNQVRTAVGCINPTGIYTKYPNDIVYASDINTLSTKLNEIT